MINYISVFFFPDRLIREFVSLGYIINTICEYVGQGNYTGLMNDSLRRIQVHHVVWVCVDVSIFEGTTCLCPTVFVSNEVPDVMR